MFYLTICLLTLQPDSETQLLTIQFEWNGVLKSVSSTLIGVSPEFEVALYTLCFFLGGEDNHVELGPYPVNIKCYRLGNKIGSVFPVAESWSSFTEINPVISLKVFSIHLRKDCTIDFELMYEIIISSEGENNTMWWKNMILRMYSLVLRRILKLLYYYMDLQRVPFISSLPCKWFVKILSQATDICFHFFPKLNACETLCTCSCFSLFLLYIHFVPFLHIANIWYRWSSTLIL